MNLPLDPSAYVDSFARDHLPAPELWPAFEPPPIPRRVNAAAEILDAAAALHAERPCLRARDATWTYAELLDKANRVAAALVHEFGLQPGHRVLLRGANSPMLAACWFGVLKAGGIAVTTMPLLRARELTEIANRAAVQWALCDERLGEELEAARAACPTLGRVGFYHSEAPDGLEAAMARQNGAFVNFLPSHDDVALIAFTSGTTGKPKATAHFHRDVLSICDTVPNHVLRSKPSDIVVGAAPFGFTYGLGSLLLFPIRQGASTLLLERCTAPILAECLRALPITTLMIGPTLYRSLPPLLKPEDVKHLRTCCSSGEHLPEAVFEAWRRATGLEIRNLLGATEMLHAFVAAPERGAKPGSLGEALPDYRVEILDDDMRPVAPGVVGRLAVRGPTGCRYLGDETQQRTYVRDGWNLTGDAFRRDEDGTLWYHARADDIIVSSGYNISGAEIEGVLLERAEVAACAVVGIPDPARGMIAKAFVVLVDAAASGPELARELQEHVKRVLAPYKYPRALEFVTALPMTSTGKIQRSALVAGAAAADVPG
jgi:2-aminobenzoate-CoA ligase